jgi:polygalacturonase
LRYSLTLAKGKFDAGSTSAFGWEALTTPMVQQGWFSKNEPSRSYFQIDNSNVNVLNLKKIDRQHAWQMELQNCNPVQPENVTIQSAFFSSKKIRQTDLLGNTKKIIPVQNDKIRLVIPKNTLYLIEIE